MDVSIRYAVVAGSGGIRATFDSREAAEKYILDADEYVEAYWHEPPIWEWLYHVRVTHNTVSADRQDRLGPVPPVLVADGVLTGPVWAKDLQTALRLGRRLWIVHCK